MYHLVDSSRTEVDNNFDGLISKADSGGATRTKGRRNFVARIPGLRGCVYSAPSLRAPPLLFFFLLFFLSLFLFFPRVLLAQVTRYIGGGTPLPGQKGPPRRRWRGGSVYTCSLLRTIETSFFSLALFLPRPPIDILSPVLSLSLSLSALALGLTRAFRAPIARNACTVSTPSPRFRIRAPVCLVFSNSLGNEIAISSPERVRNEREIRILRRTTLPPPLFLPLSLFPPLPAS